MSWLDAVPSLVTAIAWLLVPGLLTSYAFGLRGIAAWTVAPAVSTATVAVSAVVLGKLGLAWSPVTVGIAAVVPTAFILLVRLVRRRGFAATVPADPVRIRLASALGLIPAFVIGAITVARGFRAPDTMSQTYDAVFHYNALRWILDSGDASSLTVGAIGAPHAASFYPAAWHDLASLVALSSGVSVVVAANMTAGVIAVLVWPFACLFLSRQVFGRSMSVLAVTGILSVAFTAFPWGLLSFGVLWPNALGFALVPVGVGAGLSILGMATQDTLSRGQAWAVLAAVVLATGFAQPNTTFSLVALLLFPGSHALLRWMRRQHREDRTGRGLFGGLAVVVLAAVGWVFVNSLSMVEAIKDFQWTPFQSVSAAVGEVLLNATNDRDPLWLLSVAVVAGLLVSFRSRATLWVPFAHVTIAALFVMAAAVQTSTTHMLTGFWYNDSYRLAATLPITGVVLAVGGVSWAATSLHRWVSDHEAPRRLLATRLPSVTAFAGLLGALLIVVTALEYQQQFVRNIRKAYHAPSDVEATLVDPAEREFYARVDGIVPDDVVVANNPWDGSAMLWALTGTRVLYPQLNQSTWSDEQKYLAKHLNEAAQDPRACRLASEHDIGYVMSGSFRFWVGDDRIMNYPGLAQPARHPGFELVAHHGRLKLFRMTVCTADSAPAPAAFGNNS